MLESVWRKGNSLALLVGMYRGLALGQVEGVTGVARAMC